MKNKKILYCSREVGPWMDRDEEILKKNFTTVRRFIDLTYYFSFQWFRDIRESELVFLWFASYLALPMVLATKFFKKKLIIVAGGFDVAKAEEIGHGTYARGWLGRVTRTLILHRADHILCVSDFNKREAVQNAGLPADRCETIHLGIQSPPSEFHSRAWVDRKEQIVMIASATEASYRTKGVDQFLTLAKMCPEYEFILVGSADTYVHEEFRKFHLKNFQSLGYIHYQSDRFLNLLNSSKLALQLSFYESFGAAIIDAGLCGCEMLVTDKGALPEIVGALGSVAPYGKLDQQVAKIREIMKKTDSDTAGRPGKLAALYDPVVREKKLVQSVVKILNSAPI